MMTRVELQDRCDAEAYRLMATDYLRTCIDYPHISKLLIARSCGARAFGIEVSELISRSRKSDVVKPRQKLMAATFVLIPGISKKAIARSFGRDASCLTSAIALYEADVRRALEATSVEIA